MRVVAVLSFLRRHTRAGPVLCLHAPETDQAQEGVAFESDGDRSAQEELAQLCLWSVLDLDAASRRRRLRSLLVADVVWTRLDASARSCYCFSRALAILYTSSLIRNTHANRAVSLCLAIR